MPSWKDRLLPASFGGVPFKVRESEATGGRRAAVHEYPLRDRPFVEELGREVRGLQVEGYLIGDDYAAQRARLQAVFESASPGFPSKPGRTLVHPTLGTMLVLCRNFRFRETTEDGRMVRFLAEFQEVGEELEPAPRTDPVTGADTAAADLNAAGGVQFAAGAQTTGVVELARTAIEDVVRETTSRLRHLDVFSGPTRDVQALETALTDLETQLAVLISAPADLAARVVSALDAVLAASAGPAGALEAYRALREFPPLEDAGEGLQGDLARENGRQTAELVALGALAGSVRAAARISYRTLEDAQETLEDLGRELDLLEGTASDDVIPSLESLRVALTRAVPPPDRDLPSLRTITLAKTRPALAVAHELYQDEDRAQELVDLNGLRHPLRLPGSVPLRVLSR
jgi:prophage DNA circulation protein